MKEEKNRFTPAFALRCAKFLSSTHLSFEKASIALEKFWEIFFNLKMNTPSPTTLKRTILSFGDFFYLWLEKEIGNKKFTMYFDGGTAEKTFLNVHLKYFKLYSPQELTAANQELKKLEEKLNDTQKGKNSEIVEKNDDNKSKDSPIHDNNNHMLNSDPKSNKNENTAAQSIEQTNIASDISKKSNNNQNEQLISEENDSAMKSATNENLPSKDPQNNASNATNAIKSSETISPSQIIPILKEKGSKQNVSEKEAFLRQIETIKRKIKLGGEPKSAMIGLNYLFHETADDLIEIIKKLMDKMKKLDTSQIIAFITDNASNNCSAANKMDVDRFPCVMHSTHLFDCLLCLILLRKGKESNVTASTFSTLDFFRDLKVLSDFVDGNWETLKIIIVCFEALGEKCFKNPKNIQDLIRIASISFEKKPEAGENTRFFSFEEFCLWMWEKKEMLKKALSYLFEIKFIEYKEYNIIEKFLKNDEKLAAFVDICSFFKELLDLCYLREGYCIEEFFPTFDKIVEKLKDKSDFSSFPILKSVVKKEKEQKWIEKINEGKTQVLELALKHYGKVLENPHFYWSQLGNEKLFKSFLSKRRKIWII